MTGWTFDQASASYTLRVEHGVYHVAQANDGSWRAFFVPDAMGRYQTDAEAMRGVEEYLANFP